MDNRGNYTNYEKEQIKNELNEKLYKLYEIKNLSNYNGNLIKYECVINNERGLFKSRINDRSKDHIMEQVVFQIAQLTGINCCFASCRKAKDVYGSFSRFEVIDMNNVIPFSNMLNKHELDADILLQTMMQYTKGVNTFIINLYRYIIFDYITGQQDRHLDNLSVYRIKGRETKLYPLYDNGFCCFAPDNNDDAIERLDRGFYSSRMGFCEDILATIKNYRQIIYKDDLRKIIKYNNLNKEVLLNIVDKADKYNQMTQRRREATINFILRQANDIHKINLGQI